DLERPLQPVDPRGERIQLLRLILVLHIIRSRSQALARRCREQRPRTRKELPKPDRRGRALQDRPPVLRFRPNEQHVAPLPAQDCAPSTLPPPRLLLRPAPAGRRLRRFPRQRRVVEGAAEPSASLRSREQEAAPCPCHLAPRARAGAVQEIRPRNI